MSVYQASSQSGMLASAIAEMPIARMFSCKEGAAQGSNKREEFEAMESIQNADIDQYVSLIIS